MAISSWAQWVTTAWGLLGCNLEWAVAECGAAVLRLRLRKAPMLPQQLHKEQMIQGADLKWLGVAPG